MRGKFLSSAPPDCTTQCKTTVGCRSSCSNFCHPLHQSVIIAPPPHTARMRPRRRLPRYVIVNDISTKQDQDQRSATTRPLEPASSDSIAKKLSCMQPKNLGLISDTGVGFSFLKQSRPPLNFTQPPFQWILWALPTGAL
jgi:hypothetical protein